ncbi:Protein of unknown function [Hyphomicrobium facile]|uniref:DUF2842 domain-containing protein n=2 Tax=Hyphomicrobium facile TaxID=51670 RepID=A0A1I7NDH9_9HYPH|nr:Protein of unknown function [Hyphomicrobium facile]
MRRGRTEIQGSGAISKQMTQRKRKLVGTVLLLLLITAYAVLAVAVAVVLQVRNVSTTVELIYYVVAGLLWVLPAGWLIAWMQRPDA